MFQKCFTVFLKVPDCFCYVRKICFYLQEAIAIASEAGDRNGFLQKQTQNLRKEQKLAKYFSKPSITFETASETLWQSAECF